MTKLLILLGIFISGCSTVEPRYCSKTCEASITDSLGNISCLVYKHPEDPQKEYDLLY